MGIFSKIFGGGTRDSGDVRTTSPGAEPAVADAFTGLRKLVFAVRPDELGLTAGEPLAALMETGLDEGVATLVAVADGSTSLYLSNGGGIIGGQGRATVRVASSAFLADLAAVAERLRPTTDFPLPTRGRVRFYLLNGNGVRTAEASEQDLGHHRHELSPIFHSAHAVIAAVRLNTNDRT